MHMCFKYAFAKSKCVYLSQWCGFVGVHPFLMVFHTLVLLPHTFIYLHYHGVSSGDGIVLTAYKDPPPCPSEPLFLFFPLCGPNTLEYPSSLAFPW